MRNSDDLPQPLGPTMRRCWPGWTEKLSFSTRMSPLGETIGTSVNSIEEDSMVVPRLERIDEWSEEGLSEVRGVIDMGFSDDVGVAGVEVLRGGAMVALETSFFSN